MSKVVRAFHCGRTLRSTGFDLKYVGTGEGYGILGPGIYFSSSREIAVNYCKCAKGLAMLYEVEFDLDGFVDIDDHSHQWDELLRVALQELGPDLMETPYSELKYGRGVIGAIHKKAGAKRLWEILAYVGIVGVLEKLPNGEIEYAVFDLSAIKPIGSEKMPRERRKNPPPVSDIWKIPRDVYIQSKFPGATWHTIYDKFYDQMRVYEKEWNQEMKMALTYGLISLEDAENTKRFMGLGGSKLVPLPKKLYHVTSAKDEVIRNGLRTREQLFLGSGRGLGGGNPDTISLTTSMEIANSIYQGILEGRLVAKGELSLPVMIEAARRGIGAKEPWLQQWFGYYKGDSTNESEKIPFEMAGVMEGYEYSGNGFPTKPEEKEEERQRHGLPTPWEGVERWPHGSAEAYTLWRRKLTDEELIDKWFDFFKAWLSFRESAGGIANPVFFNSDVLYLSKIKPSQVAILEFKPKPGTMGYHLPAEAEYRIWDGDAVELVGVVAEGG